MDGRRVARHDIRPVDEPGDAPEALRLALRDEAVLRRVQAFELGVLLRHDAGLGFAHLRILCAALLRIAPSRCLFMHQHRSSPGKPGWHAICETKRRMGRPKLVLVGNGMAGIRAIEELLKLAPDLYEITVFGA